MRIALEGIRLNVLSFGPRWIRFWLLIYPLLMRFLEYRGPYLSHLSSHQSGWAWNLRFSLFDLHSHPLFEALRLSVT
jgi:hypothetical protein